MTKSFECDTCGKSYVSKTGLAKHICKPAFACDFCPRKFSKETFLLNHVCEQKRRFLQRDEKVEKMAFAFYVHSVARRRSMPPSHQSFARSKLYLAFVRFARYMLDMGVSNPLSFVDFLLRIELPISKWINPEVYARYIRELNKNETPLEAIERNFMLMEQWSIKTGEDWRNFFRRIAPPLATLWIITGRISPWLLFTAPSAIDLLKRLNPEQTAMVDKAVDETYWQAKIARHHSDYKMICDMLEEQKI